MAATTNFRYMGYSIDCSPLKTSQSQYAAQCSVIGSDKNVVFSRAFPALASFPSEDQATAHGAQCARDWIDEKLGAT